MKPVSVPGRAVAVATALVVGVCSCGGDDDADTAATTAAVATTSVDVAAEDQTAAEAALPRLDDFPAGWSEAPLTEKTDRDEEITGRIASCAGADTENLIDVGGAVARTGTFTGPDGETVGNGVGIAPSVEAATARLAAFAADDFSSCAREVYQAWIEGVLAGSDTGATPGTVTVARLNVAVAGDDTAAYRITIPIESDGSPVGEVYADQVLVRVGRGLSGLNLQSELAPFPAEDTDRLVALTTERLTAEGF